jgi:hypothetical protein
MNKRQRKKAEQKRDYEMRRTEARLGDMAVGKRRYSRLTSRELRALESK